MATSMYAEEARPASVKLSILPWDVVAWARALRYTGWAGMALIALEIADFGQIRDTNAQAAHENPISLIVFRIPFTFLALLLLLAKPNFPRLRIRDFQCWFFVFASYFAISTLWSTDKVATAGKALELFIGLGIVLRLCRDKYAPERLAALRMLLLLIISTIGAATVLFYFAGFKAFVNDRPGILTSTTAEAPFLSGNGVGYVSSALLLSVLAEWASGRMTSRRAAPQLAFAGFIFLFAASRTSLVIVAIGVGYVLYRKARFLGLAYVTAFLTLSFVFWSKLVSKIHGNQASSNFDTLSGRTLMWVAAFRYWKQRPWFGFGGGAGGKYVIMHMGILGLGTQFTSMHDGFLELLVGLGILGFVLATGLFTVVTLSALRQWRRNPAMGSAYVLILHMLFTTIMSTGVLAWMSYEMVFYLILIGTLDIERRKVSRMALLPWTAQRQRGLTGFQPAVRT